jgi:hypothetical protein
MYGKVYDVEPPGDVDDADAAARDRRLLAGKQFV